MPHTETHTTKKLTPIKLDLWIVALQHTATHWNTLHHTATHCSTLQQRSATQKFKTHSNRKKPWYQSSAIWLSTAEVCCSVLQSVEVVALCFSVLNINHLQFDYQRLKSACVDVYVNVYVCRPIYVCIYTHVYQSSASENHQLKTACMYICTHICV